MFTNVFASLDIKRPTCGCGAPKARVRHTSTRRRQPVKLDYFRVADQPFTILTLESLHGYIVSSGWDHNGNSGCYGGRECFSERVDYRLFSFPP